MPDLHRAGKYTKIRRPFGAPDFLVRFYALPLQPKTWTSLCLTNSLM